MATIEKRGPYQFRAKIRLKGISLTETFEYREAAEAWAAEREAEIRQDPDMYRSEHERRQHAKTKTVHDVLEKYRDEVTPAKKGGDTEKTRINAMLKNQLSSLSLADLSPNAVNDYITDRHSKQVNGRPLSGSTINRELNILSHALNIARKRWGWPVTNPIPDIERPKSNGSRTRRLVDDEEERLMGACEKARNIWLPVIVRLAIETAMRRGELLSMQWKHFDFNRHIVHVPDSKNEKARTTPLTEAASSALMNWKNKIDPKGNEFVFEGVTKDALKKSYHRAVLRAKIEGLTFHDLRHEATSRLFELHGLELHEVMAATGHSHATMTERYTHLNAQKISSKLRGGRLVLDLTDDIRNKLTEVANNNNQTLSEAAHEMLASALNE